MTEGSLNQNYLNFRAKNVLLFADFWRFLIPLDFYTKTCHFVVICSNSCKKGKQQNHKELLIVQQLQNTLHKSLKAAIAFPALSKLGVFNRCRVSGLMISSPLLRKIQNSWIDAHKWTVENVEHHFTWWWLFILKSV